MLVRCLCLLAALQLLLRRTGAVPIPPPDDDPMAKLYSPHLWVNDGTAMPLDIVTYLRKVVKCPFDIVLDNLYGDAAVEFFPLELTHSTSSAYIDVYNGNIVLLSAIYQHRWLGKMCADGIIKDLTSIHYCSVLETEKNLVKQLVTVLSEYFPNASLTEAVTKLANLKEGEECEEMCGKPYKNAMCNGVIEMALFLVDQMFAETQQKQKEPLTHETGSSSTQPPGTSPSPVVTSNSMTNDDPSNTADSTVTMAKTPPPNQKPAAPNKVVKEPTAATSISQDVVQGALMQYLHEHPEFLQTMMTPVYNDDDSLTVDDGISDDPSELPDDTYKPTEPDDTDIPTDTADTDEPTDTDDTDIPTDTADTGEPPDTADTNIPTDTADTDEPTDTDDPNEPTNTDDPNTPTTPQQPGPDDDAFDPSLTILYTNPPSIIWDSEGLDDLGSSGYSSFHFLDIFLVLTIFAVVTYLCFLDQRSNERLHIRQTQKT